LWKRNPGGGEGELYTQTEEGGGKEKSFSQREKKKSKPHPGRKGDLRGKRKSAIHVGLRRSEALINFRSDGYFTTKQKKEIVKVIQHKVADGGKPDPGRDRRESFQRQPRKKKVWEKEEKDKGRKVFYLWKGLRGVRPESGKIANRE